MPEAPLTGGCYCGSVSYQITGPLRPVVACHCSQCRKTSGHFVAATSVQVKDIKLNDQGSLRWFDSSTTAKRGFCNRCGGNLFYKSHQQDRMSIMAGTLDMPSGLKISHHIYFKDASDYHLVHPEEPVYDKNKPED